jgi:hypothetical protein
MTHSEKLHKTTLSIAQIRDLVAAISLPEGVYSRFAEDKGIAEML